MAAPHWCLITFGAEEAARDRVDCDFENQVEGEVSCEKRKEKDNILVVIKQSFYLDDKARTVLAP